MEVFPGLDLPLYLLLIPLVCLLIYLYATWPYSQLQKLGISGPPPELFFGNQRQLYSKGAVYALSKWAKEYGRVYGLYMCRQPMIVIGDIDILKFVCVKDFNNFKDRSMMHRSAQTSMFSKTVLAARGGDWKRLRSIMTPTFSSGKMRLMEPQINRCSRDLAESLLQRAQRGEKINVKECFGAFTLDAIASTAFGMEVNSQKDDLDPFLVNVKAMMGAVWKSKLYGVLLAYLPFMAPVVRWLREWRVTNRPLTFFMHNIRTMIQQRRDAQSPSSSVDFIQLLMNAEETDDSTGSTKRLSMQEIEAQMLLFFAAGYETTATTLQYLAYNLAMFPQVQENVYREMEGELGEDQPTNENVSRLKYLDQTIHETLRLYSPATQLSRMATETVTVKGVTIPAGFGVMAPVWQVMRDPEYFPSPDLFDPDRFSDKANMDKMSFLAFGLGPRTCIGMRLAMLEMKVAMVHVLRALTFVRTPDLPDTLQLKAGLSMLMATKSPLLIKAVPRQANQ